MLQTYEAHVNVKQTILISAVDAKDAERQARELMRLLFGEKTTLLQVPAEGVSSALPIDVGVRTVG